MTTADSYRTIAAELKAKALKAPTGRAAADLNGLARCYLRLAEQADTNASLEIAAEFGRKNRLEGEGA